MTKEELYKALVEKRKACRICEELGLTNPSKVDCGIYDSNQIGPWSRWQGNLDAKFLIVGQDWSDVDYFRKWEGRDQPQGNPTNCNLRHLLEILDIKIKNPREVQENLIFMTNLILCLKEGGLQASVNDKWAKNCSVHLKELIEIINPLVILALGTKVTKFIFSLYGIKCQKGKLSEVALKSPYRLTEATVLFPVYHLGARVIKRKYRLMKDQEKDWRKIKEWLEENKGARC